MTRINCVPVETLTDKHLLAEYKECTRPFNKVLKRIESGNLDYDKPDKYVLGTGHEVYFYDKLYWLLQRRSGLFNELAARGFIVDYDKYSSLQELFVGKLQHTQFWNDWTPTPEDMYVNMARLVHREFGESLDDYK
jgi:deoxyribonuclease (pyrimidine dimer)